MARKSEILGSRKVALVNKYSSIVGYRPMSFHAPEQLNILSGGPTSAV